MKYLTLIILISLKLLGSNESSNKNKLESVKAELHAIYIANDDQMEKLKIKAYEKDNKYLTFVSKRR